MKQDGMKLAMAVFVSVAVLIAFMKSGAYNQISPLFEYLNTAAFTSESEKRNTEADEAERKSLQEMETEFCNSLDFKDRLIELNGAMAKKLGMRGFYSDMGMYVLKGQYVVSATDFTTTDFEVSQMVSFQEFLDENGIGLLYVNEPTKYTDDTIFEREFGVESYCNRNADLFLERIEDAGIKTLDLRKCLEEDEIAIEDAFYRTDHHWKIETALWAAEKIAIALNEKMGHKIDLSIYDAGNFTRRKFENCWVGEQGLKLAQSYVGTDDFTLIEPGFETNFQFTFEDGLSFDGTFDNFLNKKIIEAYENNEVSKENESWYYIYSQRSCVNRNVDGGKVLILGDSYEHAMEPFLALGLHETDVLVLRGTEEDFELRSYILENGYDTVIIAYAEFMIGAHDDVNNSNYKMFELE